MHDANENGRPAAPGPQAAGRWLAIDGRVGLGSLINLAVVVIGLVAFFVRVDSRVAALEANFAEFKGDVKATLVRLETKLDRKLDRPALLLPGD
jgi:hypothetical protein